MRSRLQLTSAESALARVPLKTSLRQSTALRAHRDAAESCVIPLPLVGPLPLARPLRLCATTPGRQAKRWTSTVLVHRVVVTCSVSAPLFEIHPANAFAKSLYLKQRPQYTACTFPNFRAAVLCPTHGQQGRRLCTAGCHCHGLPQVMRISLGSNRARAGAPCPLICNPMLKSMRLQSFALQYHIHCPWVGPGNMKAQMLFVNHFANREPSSNLLYACNSFDVSCSSKLHTASHVLETLQQCGGWRRHKLSSLLGLSAEPRAAGMRCRLAQRARAAGFAAPALPRHLR